MDVILFLREIRKKGKKYKDIWIEIVLQYDGNDNCKIKLNVPVGMPSSTFYRIVNYGVELFPKYINSHSMIKNKMTLIINKEIKSKKQEIQNVTKIQKTEKQKEIIEIQPLENNDNKTLILLLPDDSVETIVPVKNKRQKKEAEVLPIHIEIISYLNQCAGTDYKYNTKTSIDCINSRINDGFKIEDFKHVIEVKSSKWLNTSQQDYLRPQTLFGNKFESYLNEKLTIKSNKQKQAYDSVSKATELGWNT